MKFGYPSHEAAAAAGFATSLIRIDVRLPGGALHQIAIDLEGDEEMGEIVDEDA
jgi:hypothetical protein